MQTHTASSADLAAALRAIAAPKAKKTDQAVTVALDHVMTLRGSAPGVHDVPSTRIGGGALLEAAVDLAALLKLTQTLGGSLELSVIPGRFVPDDLLIRQGRYSCQLYGRTPHASKDAPAVFVPDDALTVDAQVLSNALAVVCPPGFLAGVWLDRVSTTSMRLTATDGYRLISTVVACVAPFALSVLIPEDKVKALSKGGGVEVVKIWAGLHSLHFCKGGGVEVVDAKNGDRPDLERVLRLWPGQLFASGISGVELRRVVKLARDRLLFLASQGKVAVEGHESTVQLDSGQLADAHSTPDPVDGRLLLPMLAKLDRISVGTESGVLTIDAGDGVVRLLQRVRE